MQSIIFTTLFLFGTVCFSLVNVGARSNDDLGYPADVLKLARQAAAEAARVVIKRYQKHRDNDDDEGVADAVRQARINREGGGSIGLEQQNPVVAKGGGDGKDFKLIINVDTDGSKDGGPPPRPLPTRPPAPLTTTKPSPKQPPPPPSTGGEGKGGGKDFDLIINVDDNGGGGNKWKKGP